MQIVHINNQELCEDSHWHDFKRSINTIRRENTIRKLSTFVSILKVLPVRCRHPISCHVFWLSIRRENLVNVEYMSRNSSAFGAQQ